MLHINDLTYRIGPRLLFDHATVALPEGTKTGLVGPNGAGKTTLFKLITGEIAPETGAVMMPKRTRIGQVAQEAPGSDDALIDVVLAADTERAALIEEAETATDPHRIADIQTRLADIDAHSAEARAAIILSGLGFDGATQAGPCSALSGGWRMRVALAAVLFAEPDLLLLDEPTNYLDLEGTIWLESYLARYPRSVLLISHDRDLLNKAVDGIVHLDAGKLTHYRGGYDQFDRQRREQQALQLKLKKKQEDQRRHMEAFVERFRSKASRARQAQSRLKALAKLQPITVLADSTLLPFSFPEPPKKLSPPIVAMEDVSVGYEPDRPVLTRLDLRIDDDDRIALLGANGNGKSTFAKLIAGRLAPFAGRMKRVHNMRVAYFAQHQLDELKPEQTAYDHVRELMPDATEARVRARVGAMGFVKTKMDTPARSLSGGEKARLLLGLATFDGAHLLILDEPTNHLDIDSREALVHALANYSGAVILITHDQHLIEASADRLWLVADGTTEPFDGDIADYRRLVVEGPRKKKTRSDEAPQNRKTVAQDRRRSAAARRGETAALRKRIKETESLVSNLQKEIQALDGRLADGALYDGDGDGAAAAEHARARSDATRALDEAEDLWLRLSADLEAAQA
ncbi:MAG: ABC-F family ATP-binding cassette domain-containing protein [Bauldia sp.]|uniref:ABC-F family ATP-binding cassette domain-containing protein n=1 Tax=Bauldia sp. TaxID=2575872 RepID=UPI001DA46F73|nr:ABC-F family ATP-binding cassette domain-containing protein [Bauldia sp.]MCB1495905.1 ABC-F family ATP-binding cassette domain-containing protein [Bauldia sp.]